MFQIVRFCFILFHLRKISKDKGTDPRGQSLERHRSTDVLARQFMGYRPRRVQTARLIAADPSGRRTGSPVERRGEHIGLPSFEAGLQRSTKETTL